MKLKRLEEFFESLTEEEKYLMTVLCEKLHKKKKRNVGGAENYPGERGKGND